MKREFRVLSGMQLRAVQNDGDKKVIEGYAAVFDQPSEDLGWFREVIKPGAFSRCLKEGADIRCLFNHDESKVLGRTKSGTLTVEEDTKGLKFRCELPDTQMARDLHMLIERGDIDQCSFGFYVQSQNWRETKQEDGHVDCLREVTDAEVFDVSPVTFPAYPQTSCSARSLWPDGVPAEVRSHRSTRAANCECDCQACEDGECAECENPECDDPNCDHGRSRKPAGERREKKTKKVDGVELPADCFAYVGDPEDTSTWKLPIKFPGDDEKTKTHIHNAIARFGQTKGIPDAEKEKVWKKIVAAAKEHDIEVSEENSLKPGDPQPVTEAERALARVRAVQATL